MNFSLLPYEFDVLRYSNYINDLMGSTDSVSQVPLNKLNNLLQSLRRSWKYWGDQRFFHTASILLLTGCRINELPSVIMEASPAQVFVRLYCSKQKLWRYLYSSPSVYAETVGENFDVGRLTLNEREFNRRFKRYCPVLHRIALENGAKSGSHVLRYLFVSACWLYGRANFSQVREMMQWKSDSLVLDYTRLVR